MPIDIKNSTIAVITIANMPVTASDILSSIFVIFLSEKGSKKLAVSLRTIIITHIFIIGTAAIAITAIIPAVPAAFFISPAPESTVSTASDRSVPTTGTRLPTANFMPFVATVFTELAAKFRLVAAIEKSHEERYRALLKNVETAQVFEKSDVKVWECRNCGHLVVGTKAPEVCPTCAHPKSYFEVHAENY